MAGAVHKAFRRKMKLTIEVPKQPVSPLQALSPPPPPPLEMMPVLMSGTNLSQSVREAAGKCSPRSVKLKGLYQRLRHAGGWSPIQCHKKTPVLSLRVRKAAASSPFRNAPLLAKPGRRKIHTLPSPTRLQQQKSESPTRSFAREFSMGRNIGAGSFGKVFEAVRTSDGSKKAVKVVPTKLMEHEEIEMIRKVQQNRASSNVMNVDSVYSGSTETKVVTDLLAGGELLDYIIDKGGTLDEGEAAKLSKQVLKSIQTCHEAGVAHLDVKPENFVFKKLKATEQDDDNELVLIDFGSAAETTSKQEISLRRPAGTIAYGAPETLDNRASKASDLWSAGVVSYILLTGSMPFRTESDPANLAAIRHGAFPKNNKAYTQLSSVARGFIDQLLHPDPKQRLTIEEALEHSFIKKVAAC